MPYQKQRDGSRLLIQNGKPVYMPWVRNLGLFYEISGDVVKNEAKDRVIIQGPTGGFGEELKGLRSKISDDHKPVVSISAYISIRPGNGMPDTFPHIQSIYLRPKNKLLAYVRRRMIFVEWDTIHGEIYVFRHPQGGYRGRLSFNYNQILGSHWITNRIIMDHIPGIKYEQSDD